VAGVTASRQIAHALIGCALVVGGARAADVSRSSGLSSARAQVVHAGALRPGSLHTGVAAAHPMAIRRPNQSSANTLPAAASPGTQPRGTLGGRQSTSISAARGGSVEGGISGNALRRRF
jgi:hypothetical protein